MLREAYYWGSVACAFGLGVAVSQLWGERLEAWLVLWAFWG